MNNFSFIILSLVSLAGAYYAYAYLTGLRSFGAIFVFGMLFGIFLSSIKLTNKNTQINMYKRELERESITSSENSSKVRVLEAKVKTLEAALDNAIKRNI